MRANRPYKPGARGHTTRLLSLLLVAATLLVIAASATYSWYSGRQSATNIALAQGVIKNTDAELNVILTKTNVAGDALLPGVVFALYSREDDGAGGYTDTLFASDFTTDINGEIKVSGLTPGDYYFKETTAPKGYTIADADAIYTFTVPQPHAPADSTQPTTQTLQAVVTAGQPAKFTIPDGTQEDVLVLSGSALIDAMSAGTWDTTPSNYSHSGSMTVVNESDVAYRYAGLYFHSVDPSAGSLNYTDVPAVTGPDGKAMPLEFSLRRTASPAMLELLGVTADAMEGLAGLQYMSSGLDDALQSTFGPGGSLEDPAVLTYGDYLLWYVNRARTTLGDAPVSALNELSWAQLREAGIVGGGSGASEIKNVTAQDVTDAGLAATAGTLIGDSYYFYESDPDLAQLYWDYHYADIARFSFDNTAAPAADLPMGGYMAAHSAAQQAAQDILGDMLLHPSNDSYALEDILYTLNAGGMGSQYDATSQSWYFAIVLERTNAPTLLQVTNPERVVPTTTIAGQKTWVDNEDSTRPASITVELRANGTVVDTQVVTPDANGDWKWEFTGVPTIDDDDVAVTYTVTEQTVTGYLPVVQGYDITNYLDGPLVAVYEPLFEKTLAGSTPATAEKFTFVLQGETAATPMPMGSNGAVATASLAGAGSGSLGKIVYTVPGTYRYTIYEQRGNAPGYTYDAKVYNLTVQVAANADGALRATGSLTLNGVPATTAAFENRYSTNTLYAEKRWENDTATSRPASVQIQLYRDGTAVGAPVTLPDVNGNWYHEWRGLDPARSWTVDEVNVPDGYTKSVAQSSAGRWLITNTLSRNPYTLYFDTRGGAPQPDNQIHYEGEFTWQPTAPTLPGHRFVGWYTQPEGGVRWNFAADTMPGHDMTLYARYEPIPPVDPPVSSSSTSRSVSYPVSSSSSTSSSVSSSSSSSSSLPSSSVSSIGAVSSVGAGVSSLPSDPGGEKPWHQTPPWIESIDKEGVPLTFGRGEAWSLLNLMMSLTAFFMGVWTLFTLIRKKKEPEYIPPDIQLAEDGEVMPFGVKKPIFRRRRRSLKIAVLFTGVMPGMLFLLLENIRLPVTWITEWTPIIGAFFLIHMTVFLCQLFLTKRVDSKLELTEEELQLLLDEVREEQGDQQG